jgi:hypothetical protein
MSEEEMSEEVVSDAPLVTSTVQVIDMITIRTYSDGAIQRNVWESPEAAQAYADSVAEVEGE